MESKRHWRMLYKKRVKIGCCYCYLCGKKIEKEKDFSLEHVIPLSRSGEDVPSNWKSAHKHCNTEKGSLTYDEWLLYKELLKKKHGRIK